jgi:hypothetical protein
MAAALWGCIGNLDFIGAPLSGNTGISLTCVFKRENQKFETSVWMRFEYSKWNYGAYNDHIAIMCRDLVVSDHIEETWRLISLQIFRTVTVSLLHTRLSDI